MGVTDALEDKGVNIEKLTADEKQTYFTMLSVVQESQLSIEKFRDYIIQMRSAVEQELVKTGLNVEQDTFLKARLKNYMLLESFLISPEKAKRAYEDMVATIKARVG